MKHLAALLIGLTAVLPLSHRGDERRRCYDRRECERRHRDDDGDRNRKDTCFMLCNDIIIIPNPVPGGEQPGGGNEA